MDYYEIGQRIRRYRKACALSQEQLAEKVGISATHMSHIETGNTKLSLQVFVDIADALSVPTDKLLHDRPQIDRTAMRQELLETLDSCSGRDMCVLVDVINAFKSALDKYNKEGDGC